jgi:hypothetical protein
MLANGRDYPQSAHVTLAPGLAPPAVTSPAPVGGPARPRRPVPVATMGTALGLFLAVRLLGAAVVAVVARASDGHPVLLLGRSWDSIWYLRIAGDGYGRTLRFHPDAVHSDLAFFPLYPGLLRTVMELTPLSGPAAGLLVSWTAAGVAACGI